MEEKEEVREKMILILEGKKPEEIVKKKKINQDLVDKMKKIEELREKIVNGIQSKGLNLKQMFSLLDKNKDGIIKWCLTLLRCFIKLGI